MKKITITLILLLLLPTNLFAAEFIFELEDETGDEFGPGTYIYPTNQQFEPYQGLFDITYFVLEKEAGYYNFYFEFKEITNPWRAPNGFSHQLIQVYIDNEAGGSFETFKDGARVQFERNHPWNKMIKLTGWEVEVYDFQAGKVSLEDASVERIDSKTIKAKIPVEKLGNLKQAYYYVMVGSFEHFGPDNYREVMNEPTGWKFGGGRDDSLNPNVIDILTPQGISQKDILRSYSAETKNYATLRAVGPEPSLPVKISIISGFLFLLLATLAGSATKLVINLAHKYGYFN